MRYHVLTNNGGREVNEDYAAVLTREDGSFCAVLADGLGGHGRGEVASELVVRNSLSLWETFFRKNGRLSEPVFSGTARRNFCRSSSIRISISMPRTA